MELIELFTLVPFLLWHVKMSDVKKSIAESLTSPQLHILVGFQTDFHFTGIKLLYMNLACTCILSNCFIQSHSHLVVSRPSYRSQPRWSSTPLLQLIAPASSWSLKAMPRQPLPPPSLTSRWGGEPSCLSRPTKASPCTSPPRQGWTCSEPAASCSCESECESSESVCWFSSGLTAL